MKIEIQGYWNAEVKTIEGKIGLTPERYLGDPVHRHIIVCDIVIDGEFKGSVIWDGNFLNILHPQKGQLPEIT